MRDIRGLAFEITYKIFSNRDYNIKRYFSSENICGRALAYQNRAELRNLVAGIIRKKILLDFIIRKYSIKPFHSIKLKERIPLYIGIFELLFTTTPDYAAVNENISLIKKALKNFRLARLANAMLKKISFEKDLIFKDAKAAGLSIEYSTPEWIIEELNNLDYLKKEIIPILENFNSPPNYYLRLNNCKCANFADLIDMLHSDCIDFEIIEWLDGCVKIKSTPILFSESTALKRGAAYIQDISSQICSSITAETLKTDDFGSENPNWQFLDFCTAPGLKAVSVYNHNFTKKCAQIYFLFDKNISRLRLTAENLNRLIEPQSAKFLLIGGDVRDLFIKIRHTIKNTDFRLTALFDAPCSGVGVINRYPEKMLFLNKANLSALANVQITGLKNIIESIPSGASVIYSVCSIFYDETFGIIERLISECVNIKPEKINFSKLITDNLKIHSTEFGALIYPSRISDGFFIAKLKKL